MCLTISCNLVGDYLELVDEKYDEMGTTREFVELDSATVHWRIVGSGEKNLVLIHGFGPLPQIQWKALVEELHHDYTIYIPDLVYFGNSKSEFSEYSPGFQVRQLYLSLEKMKIENWYLGGLSYGGLVASLLAHEYAHRTEGLILIDAVSKFYRRSYADSVANRFGAGSMRDFLLPQSGTAMRKLIKASTYGPVIMPGFVLDGPAEKFYADTLGHKRRMIDFQYEFEEEITKWDFSYSGPVQIIWGKNDEIIPVELAYQLHDFYPNSRLDVIKRAGHIPPMEKGKKVAGLIRTFLE